MELQVLQSDSTIIQITFLRRNALNIIWKYDIYIHLGLLAPENNIYLVVVCCVIVPHPVVPFVEMMKPKRLAHEIKMQIFLAP